ncbi:MAG TPA: formyltransferase family protein [Phenylobacterium sp.]
MLSQPLRLGFLASGGGSSAHAIVEAIGRGDLAAEARLLVSNRREAPALAWAAEMGVPHRHIATAADPVAADIALAAALIGAGVELLVLSGYLRQLGPRTLEAYAGRILNIHPGPLPQFGGHGMYGARVHQAVIAAGVAESAIVIHLVDEEYDRGPEIARRAVPVEPADTAATLEARVRALEPGFFVETLARIAAGDLILPGQTPL